MEIERITPNMYNCFVEGSACHDGGRPTCYGFSDFLGLTDATTMQIHANGVVGGSASEVLGVPRKDYTECVHVYACEQHLPNLLVLAYLIAESRKEWRGVPEAAVDNARRSTWSLDEATNALLAQRWAEEWYMGHFLKGDIATLDIHVR